MQTVLLLDLFFRSRKTKVRKSGKLEVGRCVSVSQEKKTYVSFETFRT